MSGWVVVNLVLVALSLTALGAAIAGNIEARRQRRRLRERYEAEDRLVRLRDVASLAEQMAEQMPRDEAMLLLAWWPFSPEEKRLVEIILRLHPRVADPTDDSPRA